MNHLQRTVLTVVGAILFTLPLALYAENIDPSTGNTPTPPPSAGIPSAKMSGQGGSHPVLLRGTMGTTSKDGQENGMRGGRMMASDTRALPHGVTGLIQERDNEGGRIGTTTRENAEKRGRMMGTTTRDCPPSGSTTDCVPRGGMVRERIGEHRSEIFKHTGEMLLRRMYAAVDRFTKIADRIDSRIAKMKTAGIDTTSAEASLLSARSKIEDARKSVEEAKTSIDMVASNLSSGTSTLPSDNEKKPAKDALEKARQAIQAAMQSLNDVIPLLSNTRIENTEHGHASSTIASSSQRLPGMMRTKDRSLSTTTSEQPDGMQ